MEQHELVIAGERILCSHAGGNVSNSGRAIVSNPAWWCRRENGCHFRIEMTAENEHGAAVLRRDVERALMDTRQILPAT